MKSPDSTTIFLVEDNELFAEALTISLEDKGYTVHAFHSGEEMISGWEEDPDVILLDYFIDSPLGFAMNGDKILRFIRRISKNLPVVILTSNSDIGEATAMLKQGAVDYIIKDDVLDTNLAKTLEQILEANKIRAEMAANKLMIKKYRQRFLIVCLLIALAVVTTLWLTS